MESPTVLVMLPVRFASIWVAPLAELAPDLRIVVHGAEPYRPEEIDYATGFDAPPGLLASLPRLKIVFSLAAGINAFLGDPDYPKNIPLVRYVDRALSREMAQYVVMHTLMFHRRQRMFDELQRARRWKQILPTRPTEHTRIGILGLGEIGTMAAERLRDLDFPVAGWSRTRKSVPGIESFAGLNELDAILGQSDILACLLPLTADTRHILNRRTFARLPKGAFVINAARGGHLVEEDLIAAIDESHVAGAALDVFETEPLPEASALWSHPKITVTPHIAAVTSPLAAARTVASGIARHERGEPLDNIVDLARGY